jgi:hypothetical protein
MTENTKPLKDHTPFFNSFGISLVGIPDFYLGMSSPRSEQHRPNSPKAGKGKKTPYDN